MICSFQYKTSLASFTEKVRLEREEGVDQAAIRGKRIPGKGDSHSTDPNTGMYRGGDVAGTCLEASSKKGDQRKKFIFLNARRSERL